MSDLTAFDIFFFAVIGILALLGLKRGFVSEILGLMAWVGGIVAVNLFFEDARRFALGFLDSETAAAVLAVIVLFFAAFLVLRGVASALGGRVKKSVIGPLDRLLGFGFGAVKGLLAVTLAWMLLILIFGFMPGGRPDWLADARSGPVVSMFAVEVRDFVAEQSTVFDEEPQETGYDAGERDALDDLFEDAQGMMP